MIDMIWTARMPNDLTQLSAGQDNTRCDNDNTSWGVTTDQLTKNNGYLAYCVCIILWNYIYLAEGGQNKWGIENAKLKMRNSKWEKHCVRSKPDTLTSKAPLRTSEINEKKLIKLGKWEKFWVSLT